MHARTVATIGIIAILLIVGGFHIYKRTTQASSGRVSAQATSTLERYANGDYGITFSYPDDYVLSETDASGNAMRHHHTITLVNKADLPLPQDSEGPPTITIEMYQNDLDHQETEQWIRNTSASNWKLGEGRLATTTVSGMPALSYRWSGLYDGTTIALASPRWVYVFTVTYFEIGAQIIQDFVAIRDSVQIVMQ